MNETEIHTSPLPDGTFVETSFGRSDFTPEDETAKRKYTDTVTAKILGLNSKDVRAWANAHGYNVGERGRFHKDLIKAYMEDTRTQVSSSQG